MSISRFESICILLSLKLKKESQKKQNFISNNRFHFLFFSIYYQVRLTLRRIDTNHGRSRSHHTDYDSGRESPISRTDSAIVRRKRHRSTKTWSKPAKTIHPKSSKASIEQLMKLILEQGETIQHQLTKLR